MKAIAWKKYNVEHTKLISKPKAILLASKEHKALSLYKYGEKQVSYVLYTNILTKVLIICPVRLNFISSQHLFVIHLCLMVTGNIKLTC